jgi:hypothetical protein
MDRPDQRSELIRLLEQALAVSEDIEDGQTGFLIERALDQARSTAFRPTRR